MTVPGFIGVQNHAAGDDVFFRNVRLKKLGQGENAAPVIETATATPASGPAPLAVSFAATATDPDGDALTYAWDLDGDGTFETNGQTPSRTYDTPRLYAPAVRVTDPDGASATRTLAVTVQPATTKTEVPGSVGGTVPGVLALSLGASANLGAFMPGVDRDYTGSLSGTVTSSASTAALTVHDPSTTATGRLVNGPWSLPRPLQMRSGSGAFAPLSSSGTPLPLTEFTTPVGLQPVTIDVKQPIAATDSLRAGEYGKTLIFTLTATTP
jgi:PKD repeat protein